MMLQNLFTFSKLIIIPIITKTNTRRERGRPAAKTHILKKLLIFSVALFTLKTEIKNHRKCLLFSGCSFEVPLRRRNLQNTHHKKCKDYILPKAKHSPKLVLYHYLILILQQAIAILCKVYDQRDKKSRVAERFFFLVFNKLEQ